VPFTFAKIIKRVDPGKYRQSFIWLSVLAYSVAGLQAATGTCTHIWNDFVGTHADCQAGLFPALPTFLVCTLLIVTAITIYKSWGNARLENTSSRVQ